MMMLGVVVFGMVRIWVGVMCLRFEVWSLRLPGDFVIILGKVLGSGVKRVNGLLG